MSGLEISPPRKVKNPPRKAIQILVAVPPGDDSISVLYALCNDGTIWWKNELGDSKWQLDYDIPQDEL